MLAITRIPVCRNHTGITSIQVYYFGVENLIIVIECNRHVFHEVFPHVFNGCIHVYDIAIKRCSVKRDVACDRKINIHEFNR